tara:strand:+ start:1924 stop:2475 length:552 start_codon:yes stop_codon:yes gene_type:complete
MSQEAMNNIKNDVVKVTVMSVVSGYLSGKNLMDQAWQMNLAYTLLGFALYEVVLSKHIPEKMLKEHAPMVKDLAKVATMMVTVKLLSARDVNALMDQKWMMASALTLAGFATYHLVTKKLIDTSDKKGDWKQISDDWLKVGTMLAVSHYLGGGDVTNLNFVQSSANTVLGFNVGSLVDFSGGN